ncbi:Unknown protein sequence [Pseudomonas cannabina]|uniref:Uncharacterized protein n=1 Tax=Pseudomonas cannabina TaxID=86840 RepID=A0A0P9MGJ2_PSECA|nr:Unknown protein sequence [Pseudomonas cannabina]
MALLCVLARREMQRIRNRQNAQARSRRQITHVTDFLPMQLGVFSNRSEPLLRQFSPRHCAEQRQALAHETRHALASVIGRIVFAGLTIATEIIHFIDMGLIVQAVALTGAVGLIGFKKAQSSIQCVCQQEAVDRRLDHERCGDMLEALGNPGAEAGLGQRWVLHIKQAGGARNIGIRLAGCVDHHHAAGKVAVILQGAAQKIRLLLGHQQQGQTLIQSGVFISRMVLHDLSL